MLDLSTFQRLAFIKYLYSVGVAQSKQPEPMSAISLLSFHDAMEMFLQLSSEYLNVGKPRPDFMDYFDIIGPKFLPDGLSQKEAARRLNKARVSFKHHGTLPSKHDVSAFCVVAENFFLDNTKLIFGIEFQTISLVDMIKFEEVKLLLKETESLIGQSKFPESAVKSKHAFYSLINNYLSSKRKWNYGGSPFDIGSSHISIHHINARPINRTYGMGKDSDVSKLQDQVSEFQKQATDVIRKLIDDGKETQKALRIISLGINYKKYAKFSQITPFDIVQTNSVFWHVDPQNPPYSKEDAQFCFDFVIESALTLQEFDYEYI